MAKNKVKTLYSIGHSLWYNPSKKIWNKLVGIKAENTLTIFLKKSIKKNTKILELGCGTGLNFGKILSLNLKFKKYLAFDFSPDMLEIAKNKFKNIPNVKFKQKDITQLNDINEKYDIIICTWVLSHLQSPSQVINQAQKLLSQKGKMFLIFFSKPKWFINIWLYPFAKYLFKTESLQKEEINKFKNVKIKQEFSANLTTSIVIYR
ncbi:class I SAM-dependent methyltransferase [Candidatus Woesearchaeota archaeon]|jgi:ubiquinone/menaquinone biosynthesis C-methylase UbiE|nr:class I SAM-dependent methyltransferase [Candidatus Woesearchaeota archaeon]